MSSNIPQPKSYDQILSEMLAAYMARIGVNDMQTGSVVTSFFEAVAQVVYRSSGDIFQVIRDYSADRAQGEALKRIATEERVKPYPAQVSTGLISIKDNSFNKIATKIYSGDTSPNIGSNQIKVSDASLFPQSGQIYIGRGTNNVEGPLSYSSISPLGSFFVINLSSFTTKYHNISESVILAQGGVRNIPIGTGVRTIGVGGSSDINFSTTKTAIILDGENEITGIPVVASIPGSSGNVSRNSIKEFVTSPFTGAKVFNESPFTTGRDEESDDELRARIKRARVSRGLGTSLAVKNATLGAIAKDENATVTSNEINSVDNTVLFIDNGSGYEEKSNGVGLEYIVDSALGGETYFQLATGGSQTQLAKAFIESIQDGPFSVFPNDRLAILIGGVESEHIFGNDFRSNGSATAYEIVSSVNANSKLLFSARTSNNGKRVVVFAKSETMDFIKITSPAIGNDASGALFFSTNQVDTIKLYKNKVLLQKDGVSAFIESTNQSAWSNTLISGETLILKVDNTQFITYTINDADFLEEGTYISLNKSNSLESWISVLNNKIIGATASVNGTNIIISSNLGASNRAAIEIDLSSSLISKGMFSSSPSSLKSVGSSSDFTISRNTAQIKLKKPLSKGDSLSAGSDFTRGFIQSKPVLGGSLTISNTAKLWFVMDDINAQVIKTGVISDTIINVSKPNTNIIRYISNQSNPFSNLLVGDYAIIWCDEINEFNRLEGRIHEIGSNYFDIKIASLEFANAIEESTIVIKDGFAFLRSDKTPQKILINPNSYLLSDISSYIDLNLDGGGSSVDNDEILIVYTNTESANGCVFIPTFNTDAKNLNLSLGDKAKSNDSLFAFIESGSTDSSFPLFQNGEFTADIYGYADAPINVLSFDATTEENSVVNFLNPFDVNDLQPRNENVQLKSYSSGVGYISLNKKLKRVRTGDRYFISSPLNFGHNDSIVLTLDSDSVNKTFQIPMYRKIKSNSQCPSSAIYSRVFDIESGPTSDIKNFFPGFDFSNYKVLMMARNIISPKHNTVDNDSLLFRAKVWGKEGEKYRIGYEYPKSPNSDINHTIEVGETIDFKIYLKSGNAISTTMDSSTEFNVSVISNIPVAGKEQVTFTWNGVGTNPGLNSVISGSYVTINSNGEFSSKNQGTFKIDSATSTSFTIHRILGSSQIENNKSNLTANTISFCQSAVTQAIDINDYINSNLTNFISSEIINDNGTTGQGNIDTSTLDDISEEFVSLKDGINWILESDTNASSPSPQLTFKKSLEIPTFDTATTGAYSFNNGEEMRLIPTTSKQLQLFISNLSVSGITTVGRVTNSSNAEKVQILSSLLGSSGGVQMSGGSGNSPISPLTASSAKLNDKTIVKVNKSLADGIESGWVKILAQNTQKKETGFKATTNITIEPNSPLFGYSKITLDNKEGDSIFFGLPRQIFKPVNRTFHVEKHGQFVCLSWNKVGDSPCFKKQLSFQNVTSSLSISINSITGWAEISTTTRDFSECYKGDTLTIAGFTNQENNGSFEIVGVKNNGQVLIIDNSFAVSETAIINGTDISILSEVSEGDLITIDQPFSTLNRGSFRIVKRFEDSVYFENPLSVEEIVTISPTYNTLTGDITTLYTLSKVDDRVRLQFISGTNPSLFNIQVGDFIALGSQFNPVNRGEFLVISNGSDYVEFQSTSMFGVDVSVAYNASVSSYKSPLKFYTYDSTQPLDTFSISGNFLGTSNIGNYQISQILDEKSIVVKGTLTNVGAVNLGSNSSEIYVIESKPFTSYKKISTLVTDPANSSNLILVLESNKLYQKINDSANVLISSTAKLSFPEKIIKGTDSYRYNTGLIAEVNRILYGDPRDNTTYPGVAAAGAEIFVQSPLFRRIQISVNVRVNTGIPFARVTEQVRNNISALINSSPIGKSIAISDVISSVNSILGVSAVSISSPSYSPSSDLIVINPSEKALILDVVQDIQVTKN